VPPLLLLHHPGQHQPQDGQVAVVEVREQAGCGGRGSQGLLLLLLLLLLARGEWLLSLLCTSTV